VISLIDHFSDEPTGPDEPGMLVPLEDIQFWMDVFRVLHPDSKVTPEDILARLQKDYKKKED
jgi:hypothetical protein